MKYPTIFYSQELFQQQSSNLKSNFHKSFAQIISFWLESSLVWQALLFDKINVLTRMERALT